MPSYSFKKQFVPYVENGTKTQTVRAYRKDGKLPQVGEPCHLFYGMRTIYCRRLVSPAPKTREVITIFIDRQGLYIMDHALPKAEAESLLIDGKYLADGRVIKLGRGAAEVFAWNDGFRYETDERHFLPIADFIDFFATVHDLPFCGTVTYWEPAFFYGL